MIKKPKNFESDRIKTCKNSEKNGLRSLKTSTAGSSQSKKEETNSYSKTSFYRERSKREDHAINYEKEIKELKDFHNSIPWMRYSEHCGNTVREVQ